MPDDKEEDEWEKLAKSDIKNMLKNQRKQDEERRKKFAGIIDLNDFYQKNPPESYEDGHKSRIFDAIDFNFFTHTEGWGDTLKRIGWSKKERRAVEPILKEVRKKSNSFSAQEIPNLTKMLGLVTRVKTAGYRFDVVKELMKEGVVAMEKNVVIWEEFSKYCKLLGIAGKNKNKVAAANFIETNFLVWLKKEEQTNKRMDKDAIIDAFTLILEKENIKILPKLLPVASYAIKKQKEREFERSMKTLYSGWLCEEREEIIEMIEAEPERVLDILRRKNYDKIKKEYELRRDVLDTWDKTYFHTLRPDMFKEKDMLKKIVQLANDDNFVEWMTKQEWNNPIHAGFDKHGLDKYMLGEEEKMESMLDPPGSYWEGYFPKRTINTKIAPAEYASAVRADFEYWFEKLKEEEKKADNEELTKTMQAVREMIGKQLLSEIKKPELIKICKKIVERLKWKQIATREWEHINFIVTKLEKKRRYRPFTLDIFVCDKDPKHALFEGNYSQCCLAVGSEYSNSRNAIISYLLDYGITFIDVVDVKRKMHVGQMFLMAFEEKGKPVLFIDGVELLYSYQQDVVFNNLFRYVKTLAEGMGFKQVYVFSIAKTRKWAETHLGKEKKVKITKLGGKRTGVKYYIDAGSKQEEGKKELTIEREVFTLDNVKVLKSITKQLG